MDRRKKWKNLIMNRMNPVSCVLHSMVAVIVITVSMMSNWNYTRGQYITSSLYNPVINIQYIVCMPTFRVLMATEAKAHLQCWLSQLRWMDLCPACSVPAHWTGTLSQAPALAPATTSEHQKPAWNASRVDHSPLSLTCAQRSEMGVGCCLSVERIRF